MANNIPLEMVIDTQLSGVAAQLQPTVFKDGDSFCVLYGQNPQAGIFGCGRSVEEALIDWENNLHKAMSGSDASKNLKRIITNNQAPEEVEEFINRYRNERGEDDSQYNPNRNF